MRYYFLPLERASLAVRKSYFLAGPSLWRNVDNLPVAEKKEI